jgi:hypothetical protein
MAEVLAISMNREAEKVLLDALDRVRSGKSAMVAVAEVIKQDNGYFGTSFEISSGRQYHHIHSASARLAAYLAAAQ